MSLKSTWRNYRIRRHEKVLAKLKADSSSLDTGPRDNSPYYTGNKYTDYSPLSLRPGNQSRSEQSPMADMVSQVEFHRAIGRIHEDVASVSLRLENVCLQLAGIQQQINRQANTSSFYGGNQVDYHSVFEATETDDLQRQLSGTQRLQPAPDRDHRHQYATLRTAHRALHGESSRDRALREMSNSSLPASDKYDSKNPELDSLYSRMYR